MFVSNILKHKSDRIVSVTPGDSIAGVAAVLTKKRIGAVLVRDDHGALVGMLSERDIVTGIAQQGSDCLDLRARDLMTPEVITCQPNDNVTQVMSIMTDHRIRHLPVVDEGKLVGIISIGDVVKQRLAEVESEADQLREYITTG